MGTINNISVYQQPISTGFDPNTTSDQVMAGVDLTGKIAIVTGGYSGIGLETVRQLHKAGATVILPARNVSATRELFKDYLDRLEISFMDLLEPASVDDFAGRFIASGRPLHLLINNAGIMASPLARDKRGFESQFATNHLGHFQLTFRLWEALKIAKAARVINVSSLGHRYSDINYVDPNFETTPYDRWKAYGQSKTANILFSVHSDLLGKRSGIRSYALHPGRIIDTNLKKYLSQEELIQLGVIDVDGNLKANPDVNMKSIEQGAATTLFCATSALLNNIGGVHCEDSNIAEVVDANTDRTTMSKGVLPYAVDKDNAAALWDLSCRLTGLPTSW